MPARIAIGLLVLLAGCGRTPRRAGTEVIVAAAANLTDVFGRVGPAFQSQTGIHPVFSFASTAQLTRQIENSAPFDVFTAADSAHVARLEHEGLLDHRAVYARGVLALWVPPGSRGKIERLEDLRSPQVRSIALAKPELAPYGQAAMESLARLGIWDLVKPRVIYAENISMARQYGASGNADAVFTAYSLVLHAEGKVIRVDPKLHNPIDQELGVVTHSKNRDAAQKFVDFLLRGNGKTILGQYGYGTP